MKSIFSFLIAIIMTLSALASPKALPNYWIPIQIEKRTSQSIHFIIPDVPSGGFKEGNVYFLFEGDQYYSAINQGVDSMGRTRWSNLESMPVPTSSAADNPSRFVDPSGLNENSDASLKNSGQDKIAGNSAVGAAIQSGLAHAIYKGVIYTPEYVDQMNRLANKIAEDSAETNANYTYIKDSMSELPGRMKDVFEQFHASLQKQSGLSINSNFNFESNDSDLVKELKELETILKTAWVTNPMRQEARDWGFTMIKNSDQASVSGDGEAAQSFLRFAEAFADIAVGFDPVTGPIRDTFEAFTGKNLITLENLNSYDRTFAVLGALTFGFGSKLGKGLKILNNVSKTPEFLNSLKRAEVVVVHVEKKFGNASNRALHEKYLRELRATMERPVIKDERLRDFVYKRYWKDFSRVGNGSTAAAIRLERLEGLPVNGRYHTQKGEESITVLERWLQNNPNAEPSDIHAVENIILDLQDALKGTL